MVTDVSPDWIKYNVKHFPGVLFCEGNPDYLTRYVMSIHPAQPCKISATTNDHATAHDADPFGRRSLPMGPDPLEGTPQHGVPSESFYSIPT